MADKIYSKKKHALGFFQVDPMPTQDELDRYYREEYYQKFPSATYAAEYSADEKKYFNNRAAVTEAVFAQTVGASVSGLRLLDVGCGEGFFAAYFLRAGWSVKACDFSIEGIRQQNPGLESWFEQGNVYQILEKLIESEEKFDLINLSNVLEHVRQPIELL
jgi:2-polyprenyl-3-methyl-5-hydroxy-6-metoxy-1,4-benzoquinol methylase